MNVKELVEFLKDLPEDMEVILSKDSEGNGYSPLSGVGKDGIYIESNSWSGDVFDARWSADDACMSEGDWEKLKKKQRCVVLSPTN